MSLASDSTGAARQTLVPSGASVQGGRHSGLLEARSSRQTLVPQHLDDHRAPANRTTTGPPAAFARPSDAPRAHTLGSYYLIPIVGVIIWVGMLVILAIIWRTTDRRRRYFPMSGAVPFISDVGAYHRAVFITGCTLTALLFVATLLLERWLRHRGRSPSLFRRREKLWSWIAIGLGTAGAVCLFLLSVFSDVDVRSPEAATLMIAV